MRTSTLAGPARLRKAINFAFQEESLYFKSKTSRKG